MEFNLLGKPAEIVASPDESTLDTFPNNFLERDYLVSFHSEDFTSLCPVTGQPDFAQITIKYIPNLLCIETKSLKYHLHSYRNTQAFNEKIVNDIMTSLVNVCQPKWMQVKGEFVPRGGISLTAIAEYPELDLDALKRS